MIYYFIRDQYGDGSLIGHYVFQTQVILIVSAALLVSGVVLRFMQKKTGLGQHAGRCRKCGKRIDKGEMFCFDHRRDSIWEARDKYRLEGSGKFNRPQKRT
ncbi:MAG: hypothetical protein ACRD4B_09030 [Acidobacteriota bacterium]